MVERALCAEFEERLAQLREQSGVDPEEIVDVVESVMASIHGDGTSLNVRLHDDIEALAAYIKTAKAEIAAIRPDEINSEHLPAASDELSAIVAATEHATNAIFEAVERIEALSETMPSEMAEQVNEAVTRVYEACGFQDITGQRIGKVVTALQHVEVKVQALLHAFGEEAGGPVGKAAAPAAPAASEEDLMSGPQLPDNAISQDDVDAILAGLD